MNLAPKQEITLTQFTNEAPETIKQRLKAYLYTGGEAGYFIQGVEFMQVRELFEGQSLLKPEDYRTEVEKIYSNTLWTEVHFQYYRLLRRFFSRWKWSQITRLAKELQRRHGLHQIGIEVITTYILQSLLNAKYEADPTSKKDHIKEAVSALRILNWQERAVLHRQLARHLPTIQF